MSFPSTEDYVLWQDEELVALVRQDDGRAALAELALRFQDWGGGRVARLARRLGLPMADLPDVQQEAFFFLLDAIRRYDLDQAGRPGGCGFRSFVHRVLTSRVRNYVRDRRRQERHYDRSEEAAGRLEEGGANGNRLREGDPAWLVERREAEARFEEALGRLTEAERQLLECRMTRGGVAQYARERALPYQEVWKMANQVLEKVRGLARGVGD